MNRHAEVPIGLLTREALQDCAKLLANPFLTNRNWLSETGQVLYDLCLDKNIDRLESWSQIPDFNCEIYIRQWFLRDMFSTPTYLLEPWTPALHWCHVWMTEPNATNAWICDSYSTSEGPLDQAFAYAAVGWLWPTISISDRPHLDRHRIRLLWTLRDYLPVQDRVLIPT